MLIIVVVGDLFDDGVEVLPGCLKEHEDGAVGVVVVGGFDWLREGGDSG